MGTFGAELPLEDLAALMTAIEAAAAAAKTADPDDGRTMDNRRADALAAMGWSALTTGHIDAPAPTSRGTNTSSTNGSSTNGDTTANTETSAGTDSGSATAGTEASSPSARPDAGENSAQQDAGESSAQGSARDGPGRCCCRAVNTQSSAAAGSAGGGLRLQNTRGKPVTVNVTVPYSTLIGIDDHPGELAGYGTITADVARRIAAAGTWRRILTDPVNGAPLDYGRTRYEPPPDLAAFIALRDGRCVMPGCNRTAHTSQIGR